MRKPCVVCGAEFDARGPAKTCSPGCRAVMKRAYFRVYQRERRRVDPAYRRMKNRAAVKCSKKRYQTDPEFREKVLVRGRAAALARHYKLAESDPTYRARMAAAAKEHRQRQQRDKAVAGIARVAAELEARTAT